MGDRAFGTCRYCRARVRWVDKVGEQGRQALDPDPVEDGSVVLEGGKARRLERGEQPAPAAPRYRPHYTSCSEKDQWDRGRRAHGRGDGRSFTAPAFVDSVRNAKWQISSSSSPEQAALAMLEAAAQALSELGRKPAEISELIARSAR